MQRIYESTKQAQMAKLKIINFEYAYEIKSDKCQIRS